MFYLLIAFSADGGYYSIAGTQRLNDQGITPVIPPPKHAVVHEQNATAWHDKIVPYIKIKAVFMHFTKNMVMAKERWLNPKFLVLKDVLVHHY